VEGPVGKTTGSRPLNYQLPVNPSVTFQTQDHGSGQARPCVYKNPLSQQRARNSITMSQRLGALNRQPGTPMQRPALQGLYASGAIRSNLVLPGLPAIKALAYVKTHLLQRDELPLLLPAIRRK